MYPCIFAWPDSQSQYNVTAAKIAASLNNKELAAQVLLSGIDGRQSLAPAMKSLLEQIPAGGIMLFRYNLNSQKDEVKKLLSETARVVKNAAGIQPFMAADHEGGLVHRFGPGIGRLPSALSFGQLAQNEGWDSALTRAGILYRRSAEEIRELGITMVLGPVAETLNTDNRVFLETRSYGPDPDFTQAAAAVFINSMGAHGIVSVVKHFPGNTAQDPHSGISVINADKAALDQMVKPFTGLIRNKELPALMLSHVMLPALDSRRNASLSRQVTGWLRDELGFDGIIIADDYSMAAVSALGLKPAELVVEALDAGVDMIMVWPQNIAVVHAAIVNALDEGRLSRTKLLEAASRIIAVKIRYGLIQVLE